MMSVVFAADQEWWIQGSTFEYIIECVPSGMLQDEDLVFHLRPGRASGYLDLQKLEPERRERIVAALKAGVVGSLRQTDKDDSELIEFYEGLLEKASVSGL